MQGFHGLLEFGHGVARIEPAQIASLGGRTVGREFPGQFGKVGLAGLNVTAEQRQTPLGLGSCLGAVGRQQDVTGVSELHGRGAPITLVLKLQDVKARRTAHRRADLAGLELAHGVGEQARQVVGLAPAHVPARGGIAGFGILLRQRAEVGPLACLGHQLVGPGLLAGDFLLVGAFGQLQQDLADVVFRLADLAALGQLGIDLALGDADVAGGLALAQACRDDLGHQLTAEGVQRDALTFQAFGELLRGQAVVLGHVGHGTIDLGIAGLEAVVGGVLLLCQLQDHLLQDLLAQLVRRRHASPRGLGRTPLDQMDLGLQLAFGDDALIDDSHDAVKRLGPRLVGIQR